MFFTISFVSNLQLSWRCILHIWHRSGWHCIFQHVSQPRWSYLWTSWHFWIWMLLAHDDVAEGTFSVLCTCWPCCALVCARSSKILLLFAPCPFYHLCCSCCCKNWFCCWLKTNCCTYVVWFAVVPVCTHICLLCPPIALPTWLPFGVTTCSWTCWWSVWITNHFMIM